MKYGEHYKKLCEKHDQYQSAIGSMEYALVDFVEMNDFSIFYQPSDGFVLEYEANNASLIACITIIKEKGFLSIDDYMRLTI